MNAKRILNVVALASATGRYGGPYDTALSQAMLASALGCHSVLFAGTFEGDEPRVDAAGSGVRVAFHRVRRVLPLPGFMGIHSGRALKALAAEIADCDVVHLSMARELIPLSAVVLTLFHRKRLVLQTHGMMTSRSSLAHRLLDCLIRPLVSKADSVIALTTVEARDLRTWFADGSRDITVLGNPVPPLLNPRSQGTVARGDVLFIARLHPRKRVDLFVEAAALALENGWSEKYSVAGPDEGDLKLVVEATQRLSNLRYEGTLTSAAVTERVGVSDVFVLSSAREPWGNVLAVAIASGVPVVVPESAALAAKIRTYGAGVVVPDNDALAIANAVHTLLKSPQLYEAARQGALVFTRHELSGERQETAFRKLYTISSSLP